MKAEPGGELVYDTTNLRALQEQLRQLNAAAYAEGLLGKAPAPRQATVATRAPHPTASGKGKTARGKGKGAGGKDKGAGGKDKGAGGKDKGAPDAGRPAVRRLLALAGRLDDDDSPDVPGTRFTEDGVVRLLAHLRRRRTGTGPWPRFLARARRGLSLPVASGQHLVAGVALSRLQIVCRQMLEIERHGLAHLAARRVVRRSRVAEGLALMLGGSVPPLEQGPSS